MLPRFVGGSPRPRFSQARCENVGSNPARPLNSTAPAAAEQNAKVPFARQS